jgi:hypothetical protein
MADMVPAGIAVAAAAAMAFEGAYLIQALEARRVPTGPRPVSGLAMLARQRRWLAGLGLAGIGAVLQVVALRLAPLTVVQPALALGVVALVAVGGRVLGEPAGGLDLVAAGALAAGVAIVGIAASGLDTAPPSALGTGLALVVLGAPVLAALVAPAAPPGLLLVAAGAGDAVAAIAAKRLADAWAAADLIVAIGWAALAVAAVVGALASEMSALRRWPATRVGPFVLVCQTAVPVLLAPVVAGERWGASAPLVLAGLAVVAVSCWRLAASAGLLERGEPLEQDVGRRGQATP